jgi:nitroreductase
MESLSYDVAIEAAVRAPSLHNSQPWRFRRAGDAIEVRLDHARQLPASDPTGWGARLAVGAAVFNLRLALAVQGWEPRVALTPSPTEPDLLAVVSPGPPYVSSPAEQQLWEAVERRHSNRAPFWPDPVPAQARARLVTAARAEAAWLELLIGAGPLALLSSVAQTANTVLMSNPAYQAELSAWTRGGDTDGVPADGVPAEAGGPSPEPQDLLPARSYSERPRPAGLDYEQLPLVGVLGTVGDTPGDQLTGGQALQRVLLTATVDDLAVSLVSQPIEVPSAREQLRLALGKFGTPQMVLRIGYGVAGTATGRRLLAEVFEG